MFDLFFGRHLHGAVLASEFFMEFFLVIRLLIDVIHVGALLTFFYIAAAVGIVCRHLFLCDHLEAVFALLKGRGGFRLATHVQDLIYFMNK